MEIPVEYRPRLKSEGKKITLLDGIDAIWILFKENIWSDKMQSLSIIIPAYNEEAFIVKLLEKVLSVDTESIGLKKKL